MGAGRGAGREEWFGICYRRLEKYGIFYEPNTEHKNHEPQGRVSQRVGAA